MDISSTILSKLNYFSKLRSFEELSATSKIIANVLADEEMAGIQAMETKSSTTYEMIAE